MAAGGVVDARFPEDSLNDEINAEEFLQSWAAVNGADAHVIPEVASSNANPAADLFEILPREHPRQGAPPPRLGDLMVGKGYISEEHARRWYPHAF